MRTQHYFLSIPAAIAFIYILSVTSSGCAQVGAPTGGPRDTIPPRMVNANPRPFSTSFKGNRITLTFNEYIELKDVQKNVLVSPYQKHTPSVDYKLKTLTVKLKDSLLPNTTYAINFGNAIVDNNEGNPLKDFTYVFSTGNRIDSLELNGKVILAETGGADSTILALLYRNTNDTAVQKLAPDYIARLNGKGEFTFVNLPAGRFKVYALKDGDGGKTYNSRVELFGFMEEPVTVSTAATPVVLYAYAEEKERKSTPAVKPAAEKKLRYVWPASGQNQEIIKPLELNFNRPLKTINESGFVLTDTNYKAIPGLKVSPDSTRRQLSLQMQWAEQFPYRLIIRADAVTDTNGTTLAKADTIRFITKGSADYGRVVLRFSNLELNKNPVLQFVQGGEIKLTEAVTASEWTNKLFPPGEYDIRILYDDNKNGKWDPGNYSKKKQPEKVVQLTQKLSVRADWDNEQDIKL